MNCLLHSNTLIMVTVGGGLVISAAALISIGIIKLSEPSNSIEIGANASRTSNMVNGGRRNMPPNFQSHMLGPSESPSNIASMTPSHSSTELPSYSSSSQPQSYPIDKPIFVSNSIKSTITSSMTPSSIPSNNASDLPSVAPTDVPIPRPTYKPSPSSTTLSPTLPLTPKSSSTEKDTFRLRLHWEEGNLWQEQAEEKWWCMSCLTNCNESEFKKKCSINPGKHCQEGGALGEEDRKEINGTKLMLLLLTQ